MERGPLKIYPHGLPAEFSSAGRRWHWSSFARYALDPLVAVAIYLVLHWAVLGPEPLSGTDLAVLMVMAFVLLLAAEIPFRLFNARVIAHLLRVWLLVALAVGMLYVLRGQFHLRLDFDPEVLLGWLVLAPAAMLLVHWTTPRVVPRIWKLYPARKVVVVGVNHIATRLAEWIGQQDREGMHFAGFFDDRNATRLSGNGTGGPVIGRLADVSGYVKANGIDAIYISLPMATQPRIVSLLQSLADTTASIHFLPDIFVSDPIQARVTTLAGLPVVSVCETPFDGPAGVVKRIFDLTLTIAGLPLILPLLGAIAVLVRLTSPGPALFCQRRYGLDGKEIIIFKFRTMTTLEDGDKTYRQVTRGDSRVTRVGAVLRKTSLDELPQIFNVLTGSMSLIGPRPHALAVNEQYRKLIPGYMLRHKVKPGITGWAQVNGCRGGDDLDSMRRRTEYDLAYLRSWSLWLDMLIVMKTLRILVRGDERAY